MRKETRLIKRLAALFLVLLLSIESFAAVVSDNDGSAFITKAEFDSLKNNFQAQIDQYNSSIDNKIDGAIAAYLAGINVKKEKFVDNLISNYNNMMWFGNWKVYGSYKKFTGNTSKTEYANQWFVPPADSRRNFRGNELHISDSYLSWGLVSTYFKGNIIWPSSSKIGCGTATAPNSQYCPVFLVRTVLDSDGKYYVHNSTPFVNEYAFRNWYGALVPSGVADSGWHVDYYWDYQIRPLDSGSNLSNVSTGLTDKSIAKFKATYYNGSTSSSFNITYHLTLDTIGFPSVFYPNSTYMQNAVGDANYGSVTTLAGVTTNTTTLVNAGANLVKLDTSIDYNKMMKYMMLGANETSKVNVLIPNNKFFDTGYDVPVYTDSEKSSVTWRVNQMAAAGTKGDWSGTARSALQNVNNIDITLNVPLYPKYKIAELNSNQFKYKNNYLKYGQGLPLLEGDGTSGGLQISFDYDIKNITNSTSYKTSQPLFIDIKKNDYLTDTADDNYKDGYLGLVDVDNTTLEEKRFKQFEYPYRTGKVEITVPFGKDETIWMRIRPNTTLDGYYAVISNLKVKTQSS